MASKIPDSSMAMKCDDRQVRAFWRLSGAGPGNPLELCVLHSDFYSGSYVGNADRWSKQIAGWYSDGSAFVADAGRVRGVSAYATVNLTTSALLARSDNRLAVQKHRTNDDDVPVFRRFLIDIDPVRPPDISSTDEELALALKLRDRILDEVPGLRESAVWGRSGNGAWIVPYLPDYPNDKEHCRIVAATIGHLAAKFSNEQVSIDTSTKNPARLMCLPGTWKCKGSSRPERPWRTAALDGGFGGDIDSPQAPAGRFDAAAWVAGQPPLPTKGRRGKTRTPAAAVGSQPHEIDPDAGRRFVAKAVEEESARVASAPPGERNRALNSAAYSLAGYLDSGLITESEIEDALMAAAVSAGLDNEEIHKTLASGIAKGAAEPRDVSGIGSLKKAAAHARHNPPAPVPPGGGPPAAAGHGRPEPGNEANEAINDPHRLARVVLDLYRAADGTPRIVKYRDDFYVHTGTHYHRDVDFRDVTLIGHIKSELDIQNLIQVETWEDMPEDRRPASCPQVPKVTNPLVRDVAAALASMVTLDREKNAPFWIDDPGPAPEFRPRPIDLVPARNGLLHIAPGGVDVLPHDPNYFCTYALPYAYDPDAGRPRRWLKLLNDQWEGDPETVAVIHEQLGYLLTPDASQQKMFLWIGPPRSGRSTMRDVLTQLIGPQNVGATSIESMGSPHGLEPLINKTVAVFSDARTSNSPNMATMIERLVRITGDDPVDINPKGRPILCNVKIPLRLVLLSNDMPMFRDSSNAITKRYNIIQATREIPPEDRDPELKNLIIREELPGILNLAIEGLSRLRERGRFIQAASAAELMELAEEIASPHHSFASECLELDKDSEILKSELFDLWKIWAVKHGRRVGEDTTFAKNLKSAVPKLKVVRKRPEPGKPPARFYTGIRLSDEGRKLIREEGGWSTAGAAFDTDTSDFAETAAGPGDFGSPDPYF